MMDPREKEIRGLRKRVEVARSTVPASGPTDRLLRDLLSTIDQERQRNEELVEAARGFLHLSEMFYRAGRALGWALAPARQRLAAALESQV